MATDATGTPTSLGIPKINPDVDAPSGNGENAMMDSIDSLLVARTAGLTAKGDIIYTTAANTPARLPIGSSGQVLTVDATGVPVWKDAASSVPTYTWATLPISASLNSYALLSDVWTTAGGLLAAKVSKLMQFKNNDATQPWEPADGTNGGDVNWESFTKKSQNTPTTWQEYDHFVCPAKITLRGKVGGAVQGSSSGSTGLALGTTSAGTDIVSVTAGNVIVPWALTTAAADNTFAAGASIYMSELFNFSSILDRTYRATIKKMAGQA